MKITLLCTDPKHPINNYLKRWVEKNNEQHEVTISRTSDELPGGEILFLISCHEILGEKERSMYDESFVLHASDLPRGKGWSPHIWGILAGSNEITLTILRTEDQIDSGMILKKVTSLIEKHALFDEINDLLFKAELELLDFAVESFGNYNFQDQDSSIESTYYKKRIPEDSQINTEKSIAEQFDLLRVSDPVRYPAFFELHGHRYKINLEKIEDE